MFQTSFLDPGLEPENTGDLVAVRRLYTIGYGNRAWDPFLGLLSDEFEGPGATLRYALVVDVRLNNRKSWTTMYVGERFEDNLKRAGYDYYHLPHLGNRNYDKDAPIELDNPVFGLNYLQVQLTTSGPPVVLLCACMRPDACHRSEVVRLLRERFAVLEVTHL